ncbi:MAG: ThiF family adenylyltransferase [Chloroflexales bacterium]|nr:ThiF family adenylyltransferase [Chloroflexales bacterium]
MMLVTISEALLDSLAADPSGAGLLYGRLRDSGDVAQIYGRDATAGDLLGHWRRPAAEAPPPGPGLLALVLAPAPGGPPTAQAYSVGPDGLTSVPCSVVRPHLDYGRRLHGLFETSQLAGKCVAVIGLGSGGSLVATMLARCGLGRMRLVDFDRLEVHNLARHACGLSDIGRYKTRAMRDLLLEISPLVDVETYEVDVLADPAALAQIVDGCDLVVAATDRDESKLAINRACWPRAVPVVYGAAYNRAFGGDVFSARPPDGACYECFVTAVTDLYGPPPAASDTFGPAYHDPSLLPDLIAEPGLGIDVGMIALILARAGLMALLRGVSTSLPDFPTNWVLFGNRAEWIFERPLESLFVDIPKRQDCPVCNYEGYVLSRLGLSPEEAQAAAQKMLDALPNADETSAG